MKYFFSPVAYKKRIPHGMERSYITFTDTRTISIFYKPQADMQTKAWLALCFFFASF